MDYTVLWAFNQDPLNPFDHLTKHLFICQDCKVVFVQKVGLTQHRESVHEHLFYPCNQYE